MSEAADRLEAGRLRSQRSGDTIQRVAIGLELAEEHCRLSCGSSTATLKNHTCHPGHGKWGTGHKSIQLATVSMQERGPGAGRNEEGCRDRV